MKGYEIYGRWTILKWIDYIQECEMYLEMIEAGALDLNV